jgi:hypothetical protein
MDIKRLGTWKREILRRIHRPVLQQGIWRIKRTQEVWELLKILEIAANIKKKIEWIGHAVRKDQGRTLKKIFHSKPAGRRRRGRPRLRWLDKAKKDLQDRKVVTEGSQEGRMGIHN